MDLPCMAADTPPTTAISRCTDAPYDNYYRRHPVAERERDRNSERERGERGMGDRGMGGVRPAVTGALRASPPPSLSGPVPAEAVVPREGGGGGGGGEGGGGRGGEKIGAGGGPEKHSLGSWRRGGLGRREGGWDTLGLGTRRGGGGGGERGREGTQEEKEEEEEEEEEDSQAHSEQEHQSSLSVYDNLDDTAATPAAQEEEEDVVMETTAENATTTADNGCFPSEPRARPLARTAAVSALTLEDGPGDGPGGDSGESSLWSSCEIMLAESRASDRPDRDQDQDLQDLQLGSGSSPSPQDQSRLPPQPQPLTQPLPQPYFLPCLPLPHPNPLPVLHQPLVPLVPQVSIPPRVPPPLPLADPSASALRSLLTGLQQQICRQRDEYEARIHSLEQRNRALQGEVSGLRCNLAQQRGWFSVVQARVQEAEAGRGGAERRNAELQREMEQFLDTFVELNNEAKKTERIVRSF